MSTALPFAAGIVCLALLQGLDAASPGLPRDPASIEHALTRLTFGVRQGDVDRVRKTGLAAWLDLQLQPSRIPDAGLEARLTGFRTLTLESRELARDYVRPAIQARRERQRAQVNDPTANGSEPAPDQRMQANRDIRGAMTGERLVIAELASAKLLRAIYSERQLEEVLVDFWFNHFNVFARKGRTSSFITEYEREAIRPHVLGRFRELLGATAKSPAMLFYLDNWMSVAPGSSDAAKLRPGRARRGGVSAQNPQRPRPTGLNENYARELMELHTLGVDGGYTQTDVTEVARAFTGWTIDPRDQSFRFVAALHDRGAKTVLGRKIEAGGGIEDGERVLDLLASSPVTARHISRQLAQRFVSDDPPAALVDRAAARFGETNGNLREVVRTIVTSPEFFAPEARRSKIKTPLEFLVSALRATNADVLDARPLLRAMQQLGMPLYMCQPPTGYENTADAWVSPGGLVARINLANDIGGDRLRGTRVPGLPDSARQLALAIGSPDFQRR